MSICVFQLIVDCYYGLSLYYYSYVFNIKWNKYLELNYCLKNEL